MTHEKIVNRFMDWLRAWAPDRRSRQALNLLRETPKQEIIEKMVEADDPPFSSGEIAYIDNNWPSVAEDTRNLILAVLKESPDAN